MQFLICEDGSGNRRAKSAGHGWSNFLVDTEVKPGSLLIFEVVDERCCLVTFYHLTSPRKPVVSGEGGPLRRPSDGPVFRKTLQASHLKPGSAARLVSITDSIQVYIALLTTVGAFYITIIFYFYILLRQ